MGRSAGTTESGVVRGEPGTRALVIDDSRTVRVGNYEVLDRLGAGGTGTVFKARHRRMKWFVALKVLSREVAQSGTFGGRADDVRTAVRLVGLLRLESEREYLADLASPRGTGAARRFLRSHT